MLFLSNLFLTNNQKIDDSWTLEIYVNDNTVTVIVLDSRWVDIQNI